MIVSFRDKITENVFNGLQVKSLPIELLKTAYRKLWILDTFQSIEYLKIPPANHLEKLQGNRAGQYSIRINKQWRICFIWHDGNVYDAEIVDYH